MRFLFLPVRSLKPSLFHSLSRYSSLASPNLPPMDPTETGLHQALADKQAATDVQSVAVRSLKVVGAPKPKIAAAVDALKLEFESVARELKNAVVGNGETSVNREAFWQAVVNTLDRRLFYIPSFKIYHGVAGLYDYGPPGCAIKANVLEFWRQCSWSSSSRRRKRTETSVDETSKQLVDAMDRISMTLANFMKPKESSMPKEPKLDWAKALLEIPDLPADLKFRASIWLNSPRKKELFTKMTVEDRVKWLKYCERN